MNLFGSRRALITFIVIIGITIFYGGVSMRGAGVGITMWPQQDLGAGGELSLSNPNPPKCVVATAGKLMVVDSRGNVCERFALGQTSHANCCAPGEPHVHLACETCQQIPSAAGRECCELYEYCVSCCMRRHLESDASTNELGTANGGSGDALVPHSPSLGRNYTIFSWCALACRTNSQTVVNAADRHCIFTMPPPDNADGRSPKLLSPSPSSSPSASSSTSPTPVPADHWIEF